MCLSTFILGESEKKKCYKCILSVAAACTCVEKLIKCITKTRAKKNSSNKCVECSSFEKLGHKKFIRQNIGEICL